MRDECKVCMDSYVASNGSCFKFTWTVVKKPSLGGRPNTKLGERGILNAHHGTQTWNTFEIHFIVFRLFATLVT